MVFAGTRRGAGPYPVVFLIFFYFFSKAVNFFVVAQVGQEVVEGHDLRERRAEIEDDQHQRGDRER